MKKINLFFLLLMMFSFSIANNSDFFSDKAFEELNNGNIAQAKLYFNKALELNPNDEWSNRKLGELELMTNSDMKKAIDYLLKARSIGFLGTDDYWLGLAYYKYRLDFIYNDGTKARELLDISKEYYIKFIEWYELGLSVDMEETIKYFPYYLYWKAYERLGDSYTASLNWTKASDFYLKSLELNPDNISAVYSMGKTQCRIALFSNKESDELYDFFHQAKFYLNRLQLLDADKEYNLLKDEIKKNFPTHSKYLD